MSDESLDQLIREGVAHHQAGRLADAEARYRKVLDSHPDHSNALRLLGIIEMQAGRAAVAVQLIRRALTLNPAAPDYHVNLGNALKANKDLDGAIDAYREALKLKSNYPQALNNLG